MIKKQLAIPLLLLVCPVNAAEFSGRVSKVPDGDTQHVISGERPPCKVRLYGVDCPERKQPYGPAARAFAQGFVAGRTVTVDAQPKVGRYGRIIGKIMVDGKSLGRELTRAGYAWHYARYAPQDIVLARLQAEAKAARRGLWKAKNPIAPWEWRKGKR
jgi:micrococcal nuclease